MNSTNLETKVNEMSGKYKKVMLTSDYHIPYMKQESYNITKKFAKKYKPNIFIINGDLIDFYSISSFDKKPDRADTVRTDITQASKVLKDLRKILGNKTEMYLLVGNHEARFQKYLWRHAPELYGVSGLTLPEQLKLKDLNIEYVDADNDYWAETKGHLKIGDFVIMHGDSKLNGASYSKYSCYGLKNTMLNGIQQNVAQGHSHRLGLFYHNDFVGLELGCLCKTPDMSNWQNGFGTFEVYNNKSYNHRVYKIKGNQLVVNGSVIDGKKRVIKKRKH